MLKKLTLLGTAIAAISALVVPASAGATTLTKEGVLAPIGEQVVIKKDPELGGFRLEHETFGDIPCNNAPIPGVLVKNSNGEVEIVSTEGSAQCTLGGESGVSIRGMKSDFRFGELDLSEVLLEIIAEERGMTVEELEAELREETTVGSLGLEFEMKFANLFTCEYSAVDASLAFTPGSDTMRFQEDQPPRLEPEPAFCGEAWLYGGLTVETSDGTPLIFQ